MNKNLTDISIVLDRSGSMNSIKKDTIGGFNSFLKEQKKASGEAKLTLAQFDDIYDVVHNGKNIKSVPNLTERTFVPRGMTALLDAIGKTINLTGERLAAMPEEDRPGNVIFVIITDGEENSSKEYTLEKINEMITHQKEKYSWDFVFLGANQDAISVGCSIGVGANNSMTYMYNSAGATNAFASVSSNMVAYRSGDESFKDSYFTNEDRAKQNSI